MIDLLAFLPPWGLAAGGFGLLVFFVSFWVFRRKPSQPNKLSKSEQVAAKPAVVVEASAAATQSTEAAKAKELIETKAQATSTEVEANFKTALASTKKNFLGRIKSLFGEGTGTSHIEEMEEILYTSDLGPTTVQRLMASLEDRLSRSEKKEYSLVVDTLKTAIVEIFAKSKTKFEGEATTLGTITVAPVGPTVIMVVGVNGAGKTTSIGKISAQWAQSGKKVLVAAGDTFRAAAGQQLKVWTERAAVEIFAPEGITDPSALAFDAVSKAKARGYDFVIIDTAGRLHTQANLMEELKKVKRVIAKVIPEAPHEVLVVLDANSGQNALIQAREFHQALGLTGAILTKMDGTAKGGVAVGLAHELQLPIKLVGIGEKIQDLRPFSAHEFVDSIFE